MKVIDISDWQDGIDFDDIVNAGVEGVIIKALNGQSPTACVYDFLCECRKRGLSWGFYCYTHAWTPDEARVEAQSMLNLLGGETPALGIWYDIEDDPNTLPNPVKWCRSYGPLFGIYIRIKCSRSVGWYLRRLLRSSRLYRNRRIG